MKKNLLYILFGLIVTGFGIFVIARPNNTANLIALCFAIILLVKGIRGTIDTLRFGKISRSVVVNGVALESETRKKVRLTMLINALISLLIGVITFIIAIVAIKNHSDKIIKAVVYVVGAGFLLTGVSGVVENLMFKPYQELVTSFGYSPILYIVLAILLFVFPSFVGKTFFIVVGIVLITGGVASIVYAITAWRLEKKA